MARAGRRTRREFIHTTGAAAASIVVGAVGCRQARPPASPPRAHPVDDLEPTLQEIVARLEKKAPHASAFVSRVSGWELSVDDATKEVRERFPSRGAVLRAFNGQFIEEVATTELTREGLSQAADLLLDGLTVRPGPDIPRPEAMEQRFETERRIDPLGMSLQEKLERLEALHRRARAVAPDLINREASYRELAIDELYVARNRSLRQRLVRVRASVQLYAGDGTRTVSHSVDHGGTGGWELLEFTDGELDTLQDETRRLVSAGPVEAGEHVVIGDGSIAGTLAHESFGHGVELDMFVKERALAQQFLGKRVGSELVEIWDDPTLARAFGSYFFDHEGHVASPTHIVRGGVFVQGLSDLMSSRKLALPRTANGRRQDYSRKVYARMSNTFFARGKTPLPELIAGVARGIYVRQLTHGMEDPKGWGIMLGAHLGEEIKDGRCTGKLYSPVGITGYVPDVLASVDGVADDFLADPGGCGKGHKEFVPVSTGGPHLRFRARLS